MVQLVASAAASAIVTSTVAAQTQDGRARQTGAAADAGGGWFADLLAELLQDAQPSQDGAQIPADPSQQSTTDASAATGQSPDAWKSVWSAAKDQQSSADGQTSQTGAQSASGNQNNWLAAWLAALAQAQQRRTDLPHPREHRRRTRSPRSCRVRVVRIRRPRMRRRRTAHRTPARRRRMRAFWPRFRALPRNSRRRRRANAAADIAVDVGRRRQQRPRRRRPMHSSRHFCRLCRRKRPPMTGAIAAIRYDGGPAAERTDRRDTAATNTHADRRTDEHSRHRPRAPFAQTSQQALHQFSAPVTQAPSAHSGSGSNTGSQGQSGQQHGATAQTDAQTGAQTASNGSSDAASGNTNLPTFLQVAHDQTIAQQNTTNASGAEQRRKRRRRHDARASSGAAGRRQSAGGTRDADREPDTRYSFAGGQYRHASRRPAPSSSTSASTRRNSAASTCV